MRDIQGMVITLIARSSLAGVGLKFVVRESFKRKLYFDWLLKAK